MKQNNTLETSPFYSETTGRLDREQSITLTIDECVPINRCKPSKSIIQELREQKKQILESKKEDSPIGRTIEYSIGEILQRKCRCANKKQQLNKIIKLISQIQKERQISDISKDYILTILKQFSNLKPRSRQRVINDILNRATSKQDRVTQRKFLINICNYEVKFKGELTTSPKKPLNREWITKQNIETFYSFL